MKTKCYPLALASFFLALTAQLHAATYTVTNANNSGAGSLRDAVNQANATPGADTIDFDTAGVFSSSQTITLGGSQIVITAPLTIDAPSAVGRRVTVDAANQSRVFRVELTSPGAVTFRHLSIRDGDTNDDGGGIVVVSPAGSSLLLNDCDIGFCDARDGGGVHSGDSELTLVDTTLHNNAASRNGGGIFSKGIVTITNGEIRSNNTPGFGGGLMADGGAVSITGATFLANIADRGGAIHAKRNAVVAMSGGSIDHNTATSEGGGLRAVGSSSLVLRGVKIDNNAADFGAGIAVVSSTLSATNCRFTRNAADIWGGGLYFASGLAVLKNCTLSFNDAGSGAGLYAETNGVQLGNTVVAENPVYGIDDLEGSFTSLGHNLIGYLGDATGFANGVDGDIVGENSVIDARLDSGNNFTPLPRSRCLEGGDPALVGSPTYGNAPFVDLLGNPRERGVVDIGAIEGTFNAIVTNANDSGAGSLRDALNSSPTDISFDPTFFSTLRTITLTSGQITLSTDLSIAGPALGVRISGNNASRVFNITGGNVTLRRMRVIDGSSTSDGGGIRVINAGTTVTLDDAGVSNSTATGRGGGLYVQDTSTVTATNSTFSNNIADGDGGGIHINGATFNLTNSTVSTNTTKGGGGGIYAGGTNTTTIINCTFADNTCDSDAGGAVGNGGGIRRNAGTVSVGNTIVARNADASASIIHPDVSGIFTSLGHNLIGKLDGIDGSGGVPFQNGTNGDLAGTIATPLAPGLNALQQNPATSPTRVHPLQAGSPARDAGDTALLTNAAWLSLPVPSDQRGQFRTVGSTVDIGAVEYPDTNIVKISANDNVTSERTARVGSFKVRRSFDDGTNLVVNLTIAPGSTASPSDYTLSGASYASTGASTLTVTIPGGQTFVLLNCVATQDANAEGVESVSLSVAAGAGYGLDSGAPSAATVNIYDDEYTITSGANSGAGSLREAVENANVAGGGVITLPANLNVGLTSGSLRLTSDIEIVGNHATVSGSGVTGVFFVYNPYGAPVIITDLVITGGYTTADGAGVFVDSATELQMTGCTIKGNVAESDAGGMAIDYLATVTLTDCAIVDNVADGVAGGIYAAQGGATLTNVTVAGNSAGGLGGGIYVYNASVDLIGCTVTQNTANSGLSFAANGGGGINSSFNALVTLANTVVAGNFDTINNSGGGSLAPDIGGSGALSGSFNFLGNNAGTGLLPGQPNAGNNYVGTAAAPLDPKLTRINGPTDTYYEFAYDSALKDHGSNLVATTANDQRGVGRIFGTRADIGSVEMDFYLVTSTLDALLPGTLRTAVSSANVAGHGTIVFDPATFNIPRTISTTVGDLVVTASLVVEGPADPAAQLTINGSGLRRAFRIQPGFPRQVELRNIDIINGAGVGGGGVLVDGSSTLIMTNCEVRGCSSSANGGAVLVNVGSQLLASDGTFSGNSATGLGGAVLSVGTVALERVTFSGNTATTNGGALASTAGTVTNCTFSDNRANNHGGAVYQAGGASDTLTLTHCTLTLNRANDDNTSGGNGGGARQQTGILALKNTIVSGNDALGNTQDDISGAFTSLGNNLIGITTGGTGFTNGTNGDLVGANPYLGPLRDNGGPTFTHALGAGSAAVNAAATVSGLTDQRGFARPANSDIGAYELQPETYAYWAEHEFPGVLNAGIAADYDGDGFSNGLEYATGSDALSATSRPVLTTALVAGQPTVTFTSSPLASTGTAAIQLSTDLAAWTAAPIGSYSLVGFSSSGFDRLIRVTITPTGPKTFARLRFTP